MLDLFPVTLSGAKSLGGGETRFFAALRMTNMAGKTADYA
jgi:hypothetical protein